MISKHLENFPFLNLRYQHRFFGKFLNKNLLFVFELSNRLALDHQEMIHAFLALLYTDQLEVLSQYSIDFLEQHIYSDHHSDNELELGLLDNDHLFVLAFMHEYLNRKTIGAEIIQKELYRQTGLLIISNRPHLIREYWPAIVNPHGLSISFSTVYKLKTSIHQYKTDCELAANNLEKIKPFRRSFNLISHEFSIFLEKFLRKHNEFLSPGLINVVKKLYNVYQLGKRRSVEASTNK